jgi:hypothetical protein
MKQRNQSPPPFPKGEEWGFAIKRVFAKCLRAPRQCSSKILQICVDLIV